MATVALLLALAGVAAAGPPIGADEQPAQDNRFTAAPPPSTLPPESPAAEQSATVVPAGQLPDSLPPPAPVTPPPLPGEVAVEGIPLDPGMLNQILRGGGGGGGCATCGGAAGGCDSCGGTARCHPGMKGCEPFPADTFVGRFIAGLYEGICCPDPCYVPKWSGLMNSAFFSDSPRPVSHTMLRWDRGWNVVLPDRAEYFWARADGKGLGPPPVAPFKAARRLDYHDLVMYTEAARGSFAVISETTYRSHDAEGAGGGAGFGDLMVGTKSLLADSAMFQCAFQFKTFIPIGNVRKGLGTGHVSLEPSVIMALRITCDTALQTQVAEWIPIGGDQGYAGAVLRYGASLNHVLWRPVTDVQLISTAEVLGLAFQDGLYTDPILGPNQRAAGRHYVSAGGGMRLVFCDKMDFGAATLFSLTNQHFAEELLRVEFRYRY